MKKSLVRAMCLLLALALWTGICPVIAEQAADRADAVEQIIAGMSLRDKLAQMMFFSPRTWKEDYTSEDAPENVTALDDAMCDYIAKHRFGGILLFAENCADAEQTLRLTQQLRAASAEGGAIMPLIATDQEGGLVTRLGFATSGVGNMALSATGDPECAREMARVHGEELGLVGINVDFGPVLDVNDNPANPVIGVRSFGDDAETTAEYGLAFIEGLRETGTIACAKHFPGHGNTDTDSHLGLPTVNRTLEQLRAKELSPFRAAAEDGVDMVMTAHIQFPQIETQTCASVVDGRQILLPATMSRTILTGVLRDEIGFKGVIVADALDMKAIWDNFGMDDILTLTINAGVDMLLLPSQASMDVWTIADAMLNRAVELVRSGGIDPARVDESVRRILTLKQKYGMLDSDETEVTREMIAAALEGCGSAAHRQVAWDIAGRAVTLLKNENGAFPLNVREGEETLVLFTAGSRSGAGVLAADLLGEMDALPPNTPVTVMAIEKEIEEECVEAARNADHVIFVSRAWDADCLDPATENGYQTGVAQRLIDELHAGGKKTIVISAQLPYDAACYPNADAILLTYGSSVMRNVPNAAGAGSA